MAVIAPFRGLTYNFEKLGDLSNLITPPYDVISEQEQEGYYNAHPNNVIRLILGKKKTGDSDLDNRYTRSADDLRRWISEDILIRSDSPAVYLTTHEYDPGDGKGKRVRWGFIALVRIEDEGSSVIVPHERTFSAHKDDRLKLMRACSAQLSPVFGLYNDPDGVILKTLKRAGSNPPRVSFDFKDGTSHNMWSIKDRDVFKKVTHIMDSKSIFIADGHHRYETARNFRNMMRTRHGAGDGNRSFEYIMMYLTDMNDGGLTILPSHRLIQKQLEFRPDASLEKAGQWFDIDDLRLWATDRYEQAREIKDILEKKGRKTPSFGLYLQKADACKILSLKPGAFTEEAKDLHPALKKLDVVVLSRLLLQKSLGFTDKDLDNENIFHYNSNLMETMSLVDSGLYEIAFLLNPTKMDQVKEVANNHLIMPRKSTYFYPKVLTGMVFNKIDPNESVQTFRNTTVSR